MEFTTRSTSRFACEVTQIFTLLSTYVRDGNNETYRVYNLDLSVSVFVSFTSGLARVARMEK